MPRQTAHPEFGLSILVSIVTGSTAIFMTLFEMTKQLFLPHVKIWQSHTITIVFTSVLAMAVSNFIGRKFIRFSAELQRKTEIEKINEHLELSLKESEERRR